MARPHACRHHRHAIETASLEPKAARKRDRLHPETAAGYLAKKPSRSDILSVFAGIRPLVKSSVTKRTSSLSRSHTIDIGTSGMLTITGGKWTTYRKMAEDAVDQTIKLAGLPATPCRTENLTIDAKPKTSQARGSTLIFPTILPISSGLSAAKWPKHSRTSSPAARGLYF